MSTLGLADVKEATWRTPSTMVTVFNITPHSKQKINPASHTFFTVYHRQLSLNLTTLHRKFECTALWKLQAHLPWKLYRTSLGFHWLLSPLTVPTQLASVPGTRPRRNLPSQLSLWSFLTKEKSGLAICVGKPGEPEALRHCL